MGGQYVQQQLDFEGIRRQGIPQVDLGLALRSSEIQTAFRETAEVDYRRVRPQRPMNEYAELNGAPTKFSL